MRQTSFFYHLSLTEKLMVVLRDGRTLIGYLRSIDQFGEYTDCLQSPIFL